MRDAVVEGGKRARIVSVDQERIRECACANVRTFMRSHQCQSIKSAFANARCTQTTAGQINVVSVDQERIRECAQPFARCRLSKYECQSIKSAFANARDFQPTRVLRLDCVSRSRAHSRMRVKSAS